MNGLHFVLMHVPDVAAATTFYTEKLGFEIEAQQPGFVQFKAAHGGANFALSQEDPTQSLDAIELWWFVSDVDGEHERLVAQGVTIVHPPVDEPFGRSLAYQDPAGNTLYLLQLPQRD